MPPKANTSTAVNLDALHENISTIFDQAQISAANHRKNCVALYKLHLSAGSVVIQTTKNGASVKLVGEETFCGVFIELISRVLVVKKGSVVGDRVVKFVGAYVKFIIDKASEEIAKHPRQSEDDDDDDTLTSRFLIRLLKWLSDGFLAKNKTVRYRSVQFVSEMISHLGELDEETYTGLRSSLIERVYDKEAIIRAHAAIALSKLVGSEDPSEVPKDEPTILITLLEVLCCDPAPEVRRAALLNTPLTAETLEVILSRTRDTDPLTRKLVYSTVLQTKLTHPRQLSIAQREQVVKHGLGDREPSVRLAAGKLVASWLDAIMAEETERSEGEEAWEGDDGGVMRGLIAFLRIFDVVGEGEEIAVDALLSIFVTRPEYLDVFVFSPAFWRELTAESAVVARVFIEHCLKNNGEARLETASIPVVTEFAFYVQEVYNVLLRLMQEKDEARILEGEEGEQENEEMEERMVKTEVILGELLKIAVGLDYADEIGRRKTLAVVRDMLAHPQLPESLIPKCMDVLKTITPSERELIRIVVEIIIEHRDEDAADVDATRSQFGDSQSDITHSTLRRERSMRRAKTRDEMSPEEAYEADVVDLRCLMLCIAMLERVHGDFDDNSTLQGILGDLIIPAVKRKELLMRERGLISLGLCCLIAKNMALGSFQLFLNQVQNSPVDLRLKVLQLVFDLLVMYEQEFLGREEIAERIITFLLQTLETDESPVIQAVLCIGISKLLLAGFVTDPRVLTSLVLVYVSPATADNPELRQCLSYFFPIYCYSSPENQSRMQSIFMTAFDQVVRVHEELDDDQEMITPHQFGLLSVDWLDPEKTAAARKTVDVASRNVHIDLAVDILRALYDDERTGDNQKVLCQLLNQLSITPEVDKRSFYKMDILLHYLEERRLIENPQTEKIIARFKTRLEKLSGKDLVEIDHSIFDDEDFAELFEYISADAARYIKDVERAAKRRGVRVPHTDESVEPDGDETSRQGRTEDEGRSQSDTEEGKEERDIPSTPKKASHKPKKGGKAPSRSRSKVKVNAKAVVPKGSSSSEDAGTDDDDDDEEQVPAKTSKRGTKAQTTKKATSRSRSEAKPTMSEDPALSDDDEAKRVQSSNTVPEAEQEAEPTSPPANPSRQRKVVKGTKTTARSRSKAKAVVVESEAEDASPSEAEDEDDQAGMENEEEQDVPMPSPPAKSRRKTGKGRVTKNNSGLRSKVGAVPPEEEVLSSEENGEEAQEGDEDPSPLDKLSRRTVKAKNGTSGHGSRSQKVTKVSSAKPVVVEDDLSSTEEEDEREEERVNINISKVTPMKQSSKRLRSPGMKQAIMSPVHKRRNHVRGQETIRTRQGNGSNVKQSAVEEEEEDGDGGEMDRDDDEAGGDDDDESERSASPTPKKGARNKRTMALGDQSKRGGGH